MVVMLVARPMITHLLAPGTTGSAPAGRAQAALPGAAATPALAAPKNSDLPAAVELDAVQGRVGGELIRRTRDVVEQAPEEAVTVIRAWLQES